MKILMIAALALMASTVAFGGIIDCPATSGVSNTIGTANLGSSFTTCGNVSVAAGVATINATFGWEPNALLLPYLGVGSLISSPGGIVSAQGSALQFTFTAAAGTTVSFGYASTFDLGVQAFTFVVLDGVITTLGESELIPAVLSGPPSTSLTVLTSGSHKLSFGVASSSFRPGTITTADPSVDISNVVIASVPEPATISLLGAGLGALLLLRRKRA